MPAFQGSYTGTREQQALAWVEQVTGMTFDGDELGMALHNGVALAELANRLVPGTVQKISHSRMPFPQRENIAAFIEAARVMGVPDHVLFSTGDLYEQANLKQVVECLYALGEVVYSLADYDGPALGAPPAQRATRHDSASAGRKNQGERSAALEAFHQLDASDDELAALKALKADYSAQTAASIAAADYASYSADDFDVHSELAAVKAEVAALREHLDVNESTAWSAGEAQPEPIPPRPPPASTAAVPAAAAAGGRPRQQSATMAHRDRSRSRSMSSSRLSAPPPVIVEEHIPHSVIGGHTPEEAPHEVKTQEVADGVFLHTYQNTDGPPLLVTYRVETKIDEAVAVTMSFDGSENIIVLPDNGNGQLTATRTIPAHAEKTLICSVRQADKYSPARVAMSMDMRFSN